MQKSVSNSYFNFTRKERNGAILLLLIILLITAVPFFYSQLFKEKIIDTSGIQHELQLLKAREKDTVKNFYHKNFSEDRNSYYPSSNKKNYQSQEGVLFYFDPNTISTSEWKRLGVRDKTINTIQKFISKGGKFRQPEDIKKIWGLHEDEVQRLLPFVRIAADLITVSIKPSAASKPLSQRTFEMIDINLADTTALISLPGIGSKLSSRIINFRERLGGFCSIGQVSETFGLADSVFQKIRSRLSIQDKTIRKLNINIATIDELKQHPYIRYNLANLIIQYRNQHGNFSAVEDIRKIMAISDELYGKLSPYLAIK